MKFFTKTVDIIHDCSFKIGTTLNESFNASIAHLAPKILDFRKSYAARVAIAAGRTNDDDFDETLIDLIAPDMNEPSKRILRKIENRRNQMKMVRRSWAFRRERKRRKIELKNKQPPHTEGDYIGKSNK